MSVTIRGVARGSGGHISAVSRTSPGPRRVNADTAGPVYEWAERVTTTRLACFTTGRGAVPGPKTAPPITIADNTSTFERMRDDMALDPRGVAEGHTTIDVSDDLMLETALEMASGRSTVREDLGLGRDAFAPCQWGAAT